MPRLTLLRTAALDDSLVSLEFKPDTPLVWQAGQYIKIEAPHEPADSAGRRRFFTIAAAPHEQIVRIVTRRGHSSFKQNLMSLEAGQSIQLVDLPAGDVVWGASEQHRIMVAAGVGITPVYAMLKDRLRQPLTSPVDVLYFHPQTKLPFAEEFTGWQNQEPLLRITTITERFHSRHLTTFGPELAGAKVYMCGPMTITRFLLPPFNLQPQQILRDDFTGYTSADY